MRKRLYSVMIFAVVFAGVMVTGCKSKQPAQQTYATPAQQPYQHQQKSGYSEEEFIEPPCTMYDTPDIFAGSSSASGSAMQEAVVRRAALTNAQNIARQKMKHAYQGMVSDYFNLIGNNTGNTARSNIEGAGDQIIDVVVNDTHEKCIRRSKNVDDKGNITYYIGIEINKKELINKIADALDKVAEDDVRFQEYNYIIVKKWTRNFKITKKAKDSNTQNCFYVLQPKL